VFPPEEGKAIDVRWFRRRPWQRIIDAAGFEYRAPKSIRHTHTTLLLMAGKPIAWVAAQAGRTIAVTERVYFHFLPRHARGGAEALEEMLSPDTSRVSGGLRGRPRTGRERNGRSASVGRNLRIAAQSG
jgi:integrase